METRFDDLLHTIIVEKGQGIYGFFDTVFGFMYRRTDFYYEMAPGENMGFFPGQSEAIIYNFYRKYQNLHYKERVPKRNIDPKEVEEFMKQQKGKTPNAPDLKGIPIEKIQEASLNNLKISEEKTPATTNKSESKASNEKDKKEIINTNQEQKITKEPQQAKKIDEKFETISTYNGDKCDNYSWSQGVMDVSIQIKLPENTASSKLDVKLTATNLKIHIKNSSGSKDLYFDADFGEKIRVDDSYWSLEENKYLDLFIEKSQEMIWKCAFKGHKEIDTKTVDNSKKLDEFDRDTQAALKKIMYEQNRKLNGMPTTEEEDKIKMLREAWEKPDSPFKGQPFDPSVFNLNEPIYFNTPDYEAKLRAQKEKENVNNPENK